MNKPDDPKISLVGAEPVTTDELSHAARFEHLGANRSLIVRRALLSTAMAAAIPLPVMDEYVAGRVRAGLLMKLGNLTSNLSEVPFILRYDFKGGTSGIKIFKTMRGYLGLVAQYFMTAGFKKTRVPA